MERERVVGGREGKVEEGKRGGKCLVIEVLQVASQDQRWEREKLSEGSNL